MKAYFSYINSRKGPDGKRGVYGRQIVVQVLRRRVQPCELGAADAEARRGGQGVRGGRLARHRGEPRDRGRTSTRARCRRSSTRPAPRSLGRRIEASTRGRAAGSPTTPTRARSTVRRSPTTARTPRSPCCTRTTATATTTCAGLKAGLGAKASNIVAKRAVRGDGRGRSRTGREAPRLRGNGVRDLRDAEVHDPGVRDRERAQVVAGRDLHELRLSDGRHPDAREELGRRRPRRTGPSPSSTGRTRQAPRGTTTRR